MTTTGATAISTASRVLIMFPGALGDLLCLAPAIAAIARRHPRTELELMARLELAEFAVGRLGIARARSIDRREVATLFRESTSVDEAARAFFGAFERIYCLFGHDDPRMRRALAEAAAPGAVTFHRFRPQAPGHVAEAYLREIDIDAPISHSALSFLPHDLESATRVLSGIAEPKEFIAIFPGSGSPAKNWPAEKFVALADRIAEDTRAVFIMGPAESAIEPILGASRHPALKDLPLGTVAAIARMAAAFVGVDSGVSHLAAAAGTPGVVLFGPTDPARWRPLGRVTVIRREPLDAIDPSEVMLALRDLRRPHS
jgi:ADP-heptose:LPS heptosyltransferase